MMSATEYNRSLLNGLFKPDLSLLRYDKNEMSADCMSVIRD